MKITPAHDYNDYAVWERHKEIGEPINILQPDGTINEHGQGEYRGRAYSYAGLDRCRGANAVVADLTESGTVRPRGGGGEHHPHQRSQQNAHRAVSVGPVVRAHEGPAEVGRAGQLAMDAVTSTVACRSSRSATRRPISIGSARSATGA